MQKETRKGKSFYIDTNVALDYITGRNRQTVSVLEKIKSKGWKCVSCSFLTMELADYKKDSFFIIDKSIEQKWEMRRILRETYNKDLKRGDFEKVFDWFNKFKEEYRNLEVYDFLKTSNDWQIAQEVSFNSNLNAPDAIHLTSAIFGSIGGYCQVLITSDKFFIKEANKIIEDYKLKRKLKVMTVAEVEKKYFSKQYAQRISN